MTFYSRHTNADTATTGRATLRDLYATLDARKRPEDVAHMIIEVLGAELTSTERRILDRAARGSLKQKLFGYTSMLEDFARPVGLDKQIRTAETLFSTASHLSAAACSEPATVESFLQTISCEIHKTFGKSDFKYDRLNRAERRSSGMDISKRRYNKLWRHLGRMERKLGTLVRELRKLEFTKIGKSSLASKLTFKAFAADKSTACFIAYYTSRCNLRSEFTIHGQERPYDQIAEMLMARCERERGNWWAIAHVYPEQHVLMLLSDREKGELLGTWYAVLGDIAGLLREIWESSEFRRETMVVKRGNDSTTWNNTASAWNKARGAWIGLLYAMGMDSVLDAICPGKVLRLMAADVVAWHHSAGGELDPDTSVWNEVPLPWQVLEGEVPCGRNVITSVCRKHRVDAATRGWIMPPAQRKAVPFKATPELVHGVTIASPALATALRKAGWFSAKSARPVQQAVMLTSDEHGFVIGAAPISMVERLSRWWREN